MHDFRLVVSKTTEGSIPSFLDLQFLKMQHLCTTVGMQVTRMIMTTFISLLYVRHLVISCA